MKLEVGMAVLYNSDQHILKKINKTVLKQNNFKPLKNIALT